MHLQQFISKLDKAGDLVRIDKPVSTRYEIAAILDHLDQTGARAVLFERVRGHRGAVVGNLLSHRRRLALALGVAEEALLAEFTRRMQRRVKPRIVARGPVMETIVARNIDIRSQIPVLTHREKDAGPYLTSAVTLARDPQTGASGMGIYRIQVRSGNEVSLNFQNPPLSEFVRKAQAMGRELEIAIVIGMDPLSFIASVFPAAPGTDRFEIAGGLRGKAVPLVRCRTVDVLVPAQAEYVLEGRVKPGVRVHEGPFGESWGTYQQGMNPVATLSALMHRKNPTYQALLSYSGEDATLMGLLIEATFAPSLRAAHPGVKRIAIDRFDRSRLIVSLRKSSDREPAQVLKQVLASLPIVKTAVVVDDDIDPGDPCAVGFAMATRFQAKRGVVILDPARSSALDPSAVSGKSGRFGSKLGIDATRSLAGPKDKFERVRISPSMKERAKTLTR